MSYLGPTLRRKRRRPSPRLRTAAAVAVSILVNLAILRSLDLSWLAPEARRDVTLAALPAGQWEANRAVGSPAPLVAPRAAEPRPPPEPDRATEGKQVVDVGEPDPARDRRPETSRFLSQRDSAVEKETRSRHAGLYQAVAPVPTRAAPSGAKGEPATAPEPSRGRKAVAERRELALRLPAGDDLRLPEARPGVEGERDGDSDRAPAPGVAAPPGTPDGSRRKLDLRPGAALMEQLAAGPAADHLPDVEEGEGTFLNTSQWKYAGYFNRIGQQLQVQWRSEGQAQVEARDPTGQRFMYRDRLVVMDVTLDDHGVVRSVRVVRSTGVDFLDRVAEDMFRKAEAFANPPAGMVDASGRISLTFGINFVGTAPSFGLVRRPSFHD